MRTAGRFCHWHILAGAMISAHDGKSEWVISGDANQLCAGVDEKTFQVWPGFIFRWIEIWLRSERMH